MTIKLGSISGSGQHISLAAGVVDSGTFTVLPGLARSQLKFTHDGETDGSSDVTIVVKNADSTEVYRDVLGMHVGATRGEIFASPPGEYTFTLKATHDIKLALLAYHQKALVPAPSRR